MVHGSVVRILIFRKRLCRGEKPEAKIFIDANEFIRQMIRNLFHFLVSHFVFMLSTDQPQVGIFRNFVVFLFERLQLQQMFWLSSTNVI